MDTNIVDWRSGQSNSNSNKRVDGVTVEGNNHQENAAQAVNYWEEQRQLRRRIYKEYMN